MSDFYLKTLPEALTSDLRLASDHSPTFPVIFTGVKKCKIWPKFENFEAISFLNEAKYLNSKTTEKRRLRR